ncbi:MAG: aldo/keto reductase [Candidatus Micrarchaeota archaeon]|nr:aldo/keto reductase [Candidatus Micrarchaeota archaeon]
MQMAELGKTGERISEVGLGTWMLSTNEAKEVEALRTGLDAGINFVDTAEMYGTERIVGRAVSGRENIFVATKVSPTHFHYDDVIRACDASLARLGVKSIDLYQLHWPNRNVPISETMRAMEKLVDDGKIRHIGVSNFSLEELKEAQDALKKNEIVSNQVEYSLVVRDAERDLLAYCREQHMSIIAYSPLAHGGLFEPRYAKLVELLSRIGKRHGKTPAQVAINWLICKGIVVPIPKASKKEHVAEIAGAAGWRLGGDELKTINDFLSGYRKRPISKLVKPALNMHPAITGMLTWLGGLRNRKKD